MESGDATTSGECVVERMSTLSYEPVTPPGEGSHPSLEEVHRSVPVPEMSASFWRKWRAFTGPALLVSVGYMDPGNWGTDLQAGAAYRYDLLWVVALSSFIAII